MTRRLQACGEGRILAATESSRLKYLFQKKLMAKRLAVRALDSNVEKPQTSKIRNQAAMGCAGTTTGGIQGMPLIIGSAISGATSGGAALSLRDRRRGAAALV